MQEVSTITLFLCIVLRCNARTYFDKTQTSFDELRRLLDYISNRKYENSESSRIIEEIRENNVVGQRRTFTKEEIDKQEVDVHSDLEILLEGMFDNGKKAIGIHPDRKPNIKAFQLEENHSKQKHHTRRNFIPRLEVFDKYWPNATIPYVIEPGTFDDQDYVLQIIEGAKTEFEEKTCVILEEKTKDEIAEAEMTYYINITNKGDGCYSDVGRLYKSDSSTEKGQILNLHEEGCIYKSTVIHEFGHALGMNHEQSRRDRDNHVTVHFDNIDEENKYNLEKEKTLDKNPYDYFSVMQYELKSFTNKNWRNGMSFRDPDLEFLAGLAPGLSFYDAMDINKAYKCNEWCEFDIPCINGGFMGHKCECYCPEGLTGKYCDQIVSEDCGGIINLTPGQPVNISSPNYPNNYDVGKICYWLLRAENVHQRVMIEVLDFEVANNKKLSRCYNWLEVRYNLVGQPGPKYCDKFNRNKISTTEFGTPDLMMLIFDTATVTGVTAERGFLFRAEAFDVSSKECNEDPPEIDNSSNNFNKTGSSIGSVVIYECDYYYQMVGQNSITCEADGTWSNIRFKCVEMNPVFECDFEGGKCGITTEGDDKYEWKLRRKNGNKYLAVGPSTASNAAFARFIIPEPLKVDKAYCLSFYFRRSSDAEDCASLYVGDEHFYRWWYYECKEVEWTLFQGVYGPFDDVNEKRLKPAFTTEIENEDGGKYNIDIDDIIISEGTC